MTWLLWLCLAWSVLAGVVAWSQWVRRRAVQRELAQQDRHYLNRCFDNDLAHGRIRSILQYAETCEAQGKPIKRVFLVRLARHGQPRRVIWYPDDEVNAPRGVRRWYGEAKYAKGMRESVLPTDGTDGTDGNATPRGGVDG